MKSKGFTLAEILAVIVILALLITIAAPNVLSIGNKSRVKMYCAKVKNLESAAKLYGEDYIDTFSKDKIIKVSDLIDYAYYKKEKDSCSYTSSTNPCVTDPRDQTSMDRVQIKITKANKRVTAQYQGDKSPCTD